MDSKSDMRFLKKSNLFFPNSSISFHDSAPHITVAMDIYRYDCFHFMDLIAFHSWIIDLFTYVNYTYFHANYCSIILFKYMT